MVKLTLFTGHSGYELFKMGDSFWASDVKLSDEDIGFTVDKDDVRYMSGYGTTSMMYDVIVMDSVEWIDDSMPQYEIDHMDMNR